MGTAYQRITIALLPLAVLAIVAWGVWRNLEALATQRVERVAATLVESTQRVIEVQDGLLKAALASVRGRKPDEILQSGLIQPFLEDLLYASDASSALLLVELHSGRILARSRRDQRFNFELSGRDYMKAHLRGDVFHVGEIIPGLPAHERAFTVSRLDPETGIVALSLLTLDRVLSIYSEIRFSNLDVTTLVRGDSTLLVANPNIGDKKRQFLTQDSVFQRWMRGELKLPMIASSAVDGVERLWQIKKVKNQPLYAIFGLNVASIRADWLNQTAPFAVLSLMTTLGLWFLLKQMQMSAAEAEAARTEARSKDVLAALSKRLSLALNSANAGVWEWDDGKDRPFWSPETYALFGVDTREPPPTLHTWLERCVHPSDRSHVEGAVGSALTGSENDVSFEYRVLHPKLGVRWILTKARIEHDASGKRIRLVGLNIDVSERKRAESELASSEERFKTLADNISQFAWIADASGWLRWFNKRWYEFTGSTPEEVAGWGWMSFHHPDHIDRVVAKFAKAVRTGKDWEDTFPLRDKDGRYRWFLSRAMPIRNEAGEILRWFGTNTDITDLREAEEALRASEERFRGIYQHAGTGIAINSPEGQFQSCNPAFAAMVGYTEKELRLLKCVDLLHPDDRAENQAKIQDVLSKEIPSFEVVNRYVGKDGKTIWVHKHISVVRDTNGNPAHLIVLATDITERKRFEEQIGLLMREVNHRSKNLLAVVQAVAQQTATRNPQEFMPRFNERIQALAASQDLLVKNEWKGADLEELIRAQLAHFKDALESRIALRGPKLLISASAAQAIGMAIHELATNAGKYGALSNNSGRLSVQWRLEEGDRVFFLEWREAGGPPVAPPKTEGFGSIVTGAMARMSLEAKVDVQYARDGLAWRLSCLVHRVLAGAAVEDKMRIKASDIGAGSCDRRRVLVVEDEPLVALQIAQVVKDAGYEVIGPARAVPQALELLRTGCEVAILDINLGGDTSEAVACELMEKDTPFITISGYSRGQQPAVFHGAPLLSKPLRPDKLIAELQHCFEENGGGGGRRIVRV